MFFTEEIDTSQNCKICCKIKAYIYHQLSYICIFIWLMATEGDFQENIEVPPQVSLEFWREGNQNDHKCNEKLFKLLTDQKFFYD